MRPSDPPPVKDDAHLWTSQPAGTTSRRERREKVSLSQQENTGEKVRKDKAGVERPRGRRQLNRSFAFPSEVTSLEVATGANAGKTGKVCAQSEKGVAKVHLINERNPPTTKTRRRDRVGKKSEMTRVWQPI
jgi:hypothetical protein